jgi:hypothetical protein
VSSGQPILVSSGQPILGCDPLGEPCALVRFQGTPPSSYSALRDKHMSIETDLLLEEEAAAVAPSYVQSEGADVSVVHQLPDGGGEYEAPVDLYPELQLPQEVMQEIENNEQVLQLKEEALYLETEYDRVQYARERTIIQLANEAKAKMLEKQREADEALVREALQVPSTVAVLAQVLRLMQGGKGGLIIEVLHAVEHGAPIPVTSRLLEADMLEEPTAPAVNNVQGVQVQGTQSSENDFWL